MATRSSCARARRRTVSYRSAFGECRAADSSRALQALYRAQVRNASKLGEATQFGRFFLRTVTTAAHALALRGPSNAKHLHDVEERAHRAIFAPKQQQGRLNPAVIVGGIMFKIDARRGAIIFADRMARRGVAIAAAILGDDARIERAFDLDLPGKMTVEEMVGVGRDHPFGQVEAG